MNLPKVGDLLLGKYLLESLLGAGGMGVVFAAQHQLLGKRVAVKLLMPEIVKNADAAVRFMNEARAAARIENDHVAQVIDVGQLEDGLPYMVLEYLDGHDLAHRLKEHGPLPVEEVADHLMQAIEAVAHAHALGIVHRDLKPANLFLARRPDGTVRVKVLDFGISKALRAGPGESGNVTKTSAILGSPLYMSPEQLRDSKNVDHRCDVWAFGVIAYELLTGRTPFDGENAVALFAAIHEAEPESLRVSRPEIGVQLDAVVMKCLRRRPEERYASVTELASCLVPFGTQDAAHAFERTKRILPLGGPASSRRASERPPPSSFTPTPAPASADFAVDATWNTDSGRAAATSSKPLTDSGASAPPSATADPWATSGATDPPDEKAEERRRKARLGVFVALGAFGAVGVAALVVPGLLSTQPPPAPVATAPAPTTSAVPTQATASALEPIASASGKPRVAASASAAAFASASASAKPDSGGPTTASASASALASAAASASATPALAASGPPPGTGSAAAPAGSAGPPASGATAAATAPPTPPPTTTGDPTSPLQE